MKNPLRWARDQLRDAGIAARIRAADSAPVSSLRRAFAQLASGRLTITEATLATAFAHVDGVEAASAAARPDGLHVQLEFGEREPLALTLRIEETRFAPRGAKELTLDVAPMGALADPRTSDVVAVLADQIGRRLWGSLARLPDGTPPCTVVERDEDRLRVDLRTTAAARALASRMGAMLDVIDLREVRIGGGAVTLCIRVRGFAR